MNRIGCRVEGAVRFNIPCRVPQGLLKRMGNNCFIGGTDKGDFCDYALDLTESLMYFEKFLDQNIACIYVKYSRNSFFRRGEDRCESQVAIIGRSSLQKRTYRPEFSLDAH